MCVYESGLLLLYIIMVRLCSLFYMDLIWPNKTI